MIRNGVATRWGWGGGGSPDIFILLLLLLSFIILKYHVTPLIVSIKKPAVGLQ